MPAGVGLLAIGRQHRIVRLRLRFFGRDRNAGAVWARYARSRGLAGRLRGLRFAGHGSYRGQAAVSGDRARRSKIIGQGAMSDLKSARRFNGH
jgi:hypothetical protein